MGQAVVHGFGQKLIQGIEAEKILDAHLAQDFEVRPVSREQQRHGIDRCLIDGKGRAWLVEYKADWVASRTGNAFIETVSVDRESKPGWVHTCQADYLFYYLPNDLLVYVFTPRKLRARVKRWETVYQVAEAHNEGYKSRGVLVPLHELEKSANHIINM